MSAVEPTNGDGEEILPNDVPDFLPDWDSSSLPGESAIESRIIDRVWPRSLAEANALAEDDWGAPGKQHKTLGDWSD